MAEGTLSPLADPNIGKIIADEFCLEEKIGVGGIGTVYRAKQAAKKGSVAIKLLHETMTTRTIYQRFQREARIASSLDHPNIVKTLQYGQSSDGTAYLAMEYIKGVNLDEMLYPGIPLDLTRSLELTMQMADAIEYAHAHGVVHRDIKPSNMLLTRSGKSETIKLADFGMAKIADENPSLTKTGSIVGSPYYISPEQWEDPRNVDGRGDLYSLGCVFYLMVTGTLPFLANDLPGLRRAHLYSTPPSPVVFSSTLSLIPELGDLILACIRRDRKDRVQSATILRHSLTEVRQALLEKMSHPDARGNIQIPLPAHMRRIEIPRLPRPTPAFIDTLKDLPTAPAPDRVDYPISALIETESLDETPENSAEVVREATPPDESLDLTPITDSLSSDSRPSFILIIVGAFILLGLLCAGISYWVLY